MFFEIFKQNSSFSDIKYCFSEQDIALNFTVNTCHISSMRRYKRNIYIPVRTILHKLRACSQIIKTNNTFKIVYGNAKFDLVVLKQHGVISVQGQIGVRSCHE